MGTLNKERQNKYVTLVPTDKNKYILEKQEELWTKIRYVTT